MQNRKTFQNIIKNDFIIKFPDFKKKDVHKIQAQKIVITTNVSSNKAKNTTTSLITVRQLLQLWTGQYPCLIKAKTSVANFNIREGSSIVGLETTLRSSQLYRFYQLFALNASLLGENYVSTSTLSGQPEGGDQLSSVETIMSKNIGAGLLIKENFRSAQTRIEPTLTKPIAGRGDPQGGAVRSLESLGGRRVDAAQGVLNTGVAQLLKPYFVLTQKTQNIGIGLQFNSHKNLNKNHTWFIYSYYSIC